MDMDEPEEVEEENKTEEEDGEQDESGSGSGNKKEDDEDEEPSQEFKSFCKSLANKDAGGFSSPEVMIVTRSDDGSTDVLQAESEAQMIRAYFRCLSDDYYTLVSQESYQFWKDHYVENGEDSKTQTASPTTKKNFDDIVNCLYEALVHDEEGTQVFDTQHIWDGA